VDTARADAHTADRHRNRHLRATVGGHAEPGQVEHADSRMSVITRSQLWRPTDVSTMNFKVGPEGPGAYSKAEQQSIICLNPQPSGSPELCDRPFLMISDLGMTFGRANHTNGDNTRSINLVEWRRTPVWKKASGCIGNLSKSITGTLEDPVINEEGRRFLADLLVQLSDRQIRDLFEVARVELRARIPGEAASGSATIDE
jgi:hypothetical protein